MRIRAQEKPAKLRGHLHYLEEMGGSAAQILSGTGVSYGSIDALTPMPVEQIAALFDVLASRTPDDFAIRCGLATRPQYMGILGYRLSNCATIRELLETWNRYSIVIGYPLESRLLVTGDRFQLEFRPRYQLSRRALRFCMETTMAGSMPAIRAMSGRAIDAISYSFPFPAPDALTCYAPLAPAALCFNGDAGTITGRRSDIELGLEASDPEARALCDGYCQQALARIDRSKSISERLHSVLAASPTHMPSAAEVAAQLHISVRTLQRQLTEEGLCFQQCISDFRYARACRMLEEGLESKTIAYSLGFRDGGSFSRAFRHWSGASPRNWRRNMADRQTMAGGRI